jgi:hypothetical protein
VRSSYQTPKNISVRSGDRKTIQATNNSAQQSWESFKQSYRQIDLSITTQSAFLPESEIEADILQMSPGELDSEIKDLISQLNQLRSARYHKSRRIAYEQHISYVQQMEEIKQAERREKLQKSREAIGKKLRGSARRIFKRCNLTPLEMFQELQERGIIPKPDSKEVK